MKKKNLLPWYAKIRQLWHANFQSFLDIICFCRYIAIVDDETHNIIQSKYNSFARLTNKCYGPQSNMFDLNINNSSYTRRETEESVLKHGLRFYIPLYRIKRICIFWIQSSLCLSSETSGQNLYCPFCWTCPHVSNIDRSDFYLLCKRFNAVKSLRYYDSIVKSKPDKGFGVVIHNRCDYCKLNNHG